MPHEAIPRRASSGRHTSSEEEHAVGLVRKRRSELGTEHGPIHRVAGQRGVGVDSARARTRRADVDDDGKPGTTSANAERIPG
jgi:transposase